MDLIIRYINVLLTIYMFCIFGWALMSWFQLPYHPVLSKIRGFLNDVVEPYMRLFRGLLPNMGGIDLSPMIGILVLIILQNILGSLA